MFAPVQARNLQVGKDKCAHVAKPMCKTTHKTNATRHAHAPTMFALVQQQLFKCTNNTHFLQLNVQTHTTTIAHVQTNIAMLQDQLCH